MNSRRWCVFSLGDCALIFCAASVFADEVLSPVTLAEVASEVLRDQVVLSGTAEAPRRAALSPRVDGLVTELFVDEGVAVDAGSPILRLDARIAELETESAAARASGAEARHADAVRIRDELLSLKKGRHASETETQSAIANVDMTAAALSGERASLALAREVVERHTLEAPFAGLVTAKHVEVGEWAKRDEAAVELLALGRVRIRTTLPQRDYARVVPGATATLRFDALPEREFVGEILARVPSGDNRTRSFPVLIDLDNRDGLVAPGMSARVRVDLAGGLSETLTVPRDAVIAKSDGSREVWRVRLDDGVPNAYPVSVEIGRARGDRLEVLPGELDVGDQVVLLGNERLRPGQTVSPRDGSVAYRGSGGD
ncbi:MAG: efflux RND transporter periplasmic adaptor subunit [Thiohalocapsa sp.]